MYALRWVLRAGRTPSMLRRVQVLFSATVLTVVVIVGGFAVVGPTASAVPDSEDVITCRSGPVSRDGIDTSSASAVRVPAGTDVPAGCHRN